MHIMNSMKEPLLVFQFTSKRTAMDALDTFDELGYEPDLMEEDSQPKVAIRVVNEDLTSALEIGQAFGGVLLEEQQGQDRMDEHRVLSMAYELDSDRTDEADRGGAGVYAGHEVDNSRLDATGPEPEIPDSDEGPLYDVSEESYNHFSGEVHA